MIFYILKRVLLSIVIVWGILSVTFVLIHLAPGDPLSLYITPEISSETVEILRTQFGLDLSRGKQYLNMIYNFVQGNFGVSFLYKQPVIKVISQVIPNTLQLTLVVFIFQIILGTLLGVFTGLKKGTKVDKVINATLLIFYSVPGFWLALMFIMVFSYLLGWLPSSQMYTIDISQNFWVIVLDRIKHLILPGTVLFLPFLAYTARFVRGSYCEVLKQEYIRTAHAYGLQRRKIYLKYALKNTSLDLATLIGLYFPFLLGGAVITEYVFAWPGIGRMTIEAIFAHDYPLILASSVIAAISVNLGNLFSDLLYLFIDPRIKLGNR
jgi:peptide/nickel transport system permease protein